ncbi:OmpA family protein [Albidovulum sp.]
MRRLLAPLLLIAGTAQAAPTLSLPPSAQRVAAERSAMGSYRVPVSPWRDGRMDGLAAEGEVTQTAWRIRDPAATTMSVLSGLRAQLRDEGFEVLFECDTDDCGGFDFRFAINVLPEPDMHVDLGDFRFLSARRGDGADADYVTVLVSRSFEGCFLQVTRVGAAISQGPDPLVSAPAAAAARPALRAPATDEEMRLALTRDGKVVLDDLAFASGGATLEGDDYSSLALLAAVMKADPAMTVALVGHTDAVGALEANIALSRKRAQAVRDLLVTHYGIDPARVSADGVGYLSPLASNLDPQGRARNRRVEALVTSTR